MELSIFSLAVWVPALLIIGAVAGMFILRNNPKLMPLLNGLASKVDDLRDEIAELRDQIEDLDSGAPSPADEVLGLKGSSVSAGIGNWVADLLKLADTHPDAAKRQCERMIATLKGALQRWGCDPEQPESVFSTRWARWPEYVKSLSGYYLYINEIESVIGLIDRRLGG